MHWRAYLALIEPYNHLGISLLMSLVFSALLGGIPLQTAMLLAVMFVLLAGGQNSLNAMTDAAADRVSWPSRPLPLGLIKMTSAQIFTKALFAGGSLIILLLTTVHVSIWFLGLMLTDVALMFAYSSRPFRLKRFPLIGNLTASSFVVVFPYLGNLVLSSNQRPALFVATAFFLLSVATFIVEDLVTLKGDKLIGDTTLPLAIGRQPSVLVALSLYGLVFLETFVQWWSSPSMVLSFLAMMSSLALVASASMLLRERTNPDVFLRICQVWALTTGLLLAMGQLLNFVLSGA
ncbi:MAG: UbiA family prenyltransferase [Thaumarchaeota archaeon]|nr:UbiA family prenyltransferase [Nitrososphaerota archaeon]